MAGGRARDRTERLALEAQLSHVTDLEIIARTERMRAAGVSCCWFSDRPCPPWLGAVPSLRLGPAGAGQGLVVVEGLMRFAGVWQPMPSNGSITVISRMG